MKNPNVLLAMGYGEEVCQRCKKSNVEVITEPTNRKLCKPCVVEVVEIYLNDEAARAEARRIIVNPPEDSVTVARDAAVRTEDGERYVEARVWLPRA